MLDLFRKYRIHLLAGCLILLALLFYSANLRHREKTTVLEKGVLLITAPLQRGVDRAWDLFSGWWNDYLWLVDTKQENLRLRAENRQLRAELDGVEEIRLANERLQRLLDFRQGIDLPALPAQVIGEDASSWFRSVVIDKGTSDGVREGMPVVAAEGAVGRVIKTAASSSRVLLVTDASSAVASLVQRNRTRGVCRGQGDTLSLEFASRRSDIDVGDRIITSGTGGVFPKGLFLGKVSQVSKDGFGLFQNVVVTPSVDFSRLEEVLVLLKDPQ
ncbi:MAG: rod shape-determining protein MreC [Desulfuromonadales bacterium]|jgi:rod shape-determining protein MreC